MRVGNRWEHTQNEQKQKYVGTQGRGCACKRRSGWDDMCISFLRAAINKVPKTGELQQQKLVSQFRKLEVKIKVSAGLLPPEGSLSGPCSMPVSCLAMVCCQSLGFLGM